MTLEDIIKKFEGYSLIAPVAEIARDPTKHIVPEVFDNYLKYMNEYEDVADDAIANMAADEELTHDDMRMRRNMQSAHNSALNNLIEKVKEEYVPAIENLGEEELKEFAFSLSKEGKKGNELMHKISEGDLESAKKAYAEEYKSKPMKDYIKGMGKAGVEKYAANVYLNRLKARFLEKISDEKQVDGKKKMVFNKDKAIEYIKNIHDEYKKDSEKKQFYMTLGSQYYKSKQQKRN